MELLFILSISSIYIIAIIILFYAWRTFSEESSEQKDNNLSDLVDFKDGQDMFKYLDQLIHENFNYYLYSHLLPIYMEGKTPDKKTTNDLKQKIFISIVGSISENMKNRILLYFSEKGIKIYINQKIMVHVNKVDFKAHGETNSFNNIKLNNIKSFIP